jgi:hypothetical protein
VQQRAAERLGLHAGDRPVRRQHPAAADPDGERDAGAHAERHAPADAHADEHPAAANAHTDPASARRQPGLEPGVRERTHRLDLSPVHGGTHALAGAADNNNFAQCTQTIGVQAGHSYTLSAWVQGTYAFIGVTGTGTNDTSTFTPSSASFTQLSVAFATGTSTTSMTIFVHGWYAQGTIFADDFSVS